MSPNWTGRMQQASTAATAVSVCGPDGGRHVDIGLQLEGGQDLAQGMRHMRRALRGALAAPIAGELLLVHGSGLIPHLDVARGERLAAGKMSAWVLDTPLAEYSRSTEAFVARRVTRQIFATVVGQPLALGGGWLEHRGAADPFTVDVGLQALLWHCAGRGWKIRSYDNVFTA